MRQLGELPLGEAAKQAAGNWREFSNFLWYDRPKDAEKRAIFYTHNRDSGLVDQCNDVAIYNALMPYMEGDDPDVRQERHDHWAVSWVEGYSIRVFKRGGITKAFRTYHALAKRLLDYPLLDESDYSAWEHEATCENIREAAWRLKEEYELPANWVAEAFSWLWDNDDSAVENVDDQGGYPTEEQLRKAFDALGYKQTATV